MEDENPGATNHTPSDATRNLVPLENVVNGPALAPGPEGGVATPVTQGHASNDRLPKCCLSPKRRVF
jgi:hypothetical protein